MVEFGHCATPSGAVRSNAMSGLLLERVPCPRCGSAASTPRLAGRDHLHGIEGLFTAVSCDGCGLWFQNPRPTVETIALAYPESYGPHASGVTTIDPPLDPRTVDELRDLGYPAPPLRREGASRWWQRWRAGVDLIPRFVDDGMVLEIGAATGARLNALRELGWKRLSGIEIVPAAADVARRAGFDVSVGPAESVIRELPSAAFDVVIASFVLEHLLDPFGLTREVARVLKPGGQFLFSTIARDCIEQRIWGRYWAGFDFPRHVVYFGTGDLRRLVANDFQWVESYRHAAPQDFSRSAWWRLMERRNLTDRVVGRLVKTRAGLTAIKIVSWLGMTTRISVRCRRL